MALTDTMFFIEVMVEELKTFVNCSKFYIKSEFADVFFVYLKDPNILERFSSKLTRPMKKKRKVKNGKSVEQVSTAPTVQTGQTVFFAFKVDTLISNMKQYPLELSLWSKDVPDYKIGSTQIPWSAPYFEYLNMLYTERAQEPICVRGDYAIFEEANSKRMAIIKLSVKLRHFKDKITTQYMSPSQVIQQTEMNTPLNSKPGSALSTKVKDIPINFTEETGIIKTIYSGDKRRPVRTKQKSLKKKGIKNIDRVGSEKHVAQDETAQVDRTVKRRLNSGVIHLVRSERNFDKNPTLTVVKSKSCSSIVQKRNLDILNYYIFGAGAGPFDSQVYCVSYFTVKNDIADPSNPKAPSGKSATPWNTSKEFEKEKDRYKIRICKSECLKLAPHNRTQSACSLEITKKAAPLITVTKCSEVKCPVQKIRELPTPSDDGIFIDLSSRRADCCTEEMVTRIKAKMTFGSHPCYCESECQFGFKKETTFCKICGGYEKFGEDYVTVPGYELPFPCPIFHKIKVSSSKEGRDTKKKTTTAEKKESKAKQSANEEEESSSQIGKQKKTDDRFKFNYGYKAPHIGHGCCALPCVGALGAVPRSMGWLWTSENVPGLKVCKGWKPGAISNRLLKQLNKAKRQTRPKQGVQPKKKTIKKRIEDKPTLIICKRNGEYRVEMQVSPEDSDVNIDQCDPLVYRFTREDNEERIQKRLRKRHRLVKEAIDKVWVDPYQPEICEKTCLKAFNEAVGLADANNPECACTVEEDTVCSCCNGAEENDDSSECSSMDLEWEIHFSPPIASQAC